MANLNGYLTEYAESHQNRTNVRLHTICVPLITWSLLGFLHTFVLGIDHVRLSHLFAIFALVYYSIFKNWKVLLVMTLVSALMILSFEFVPDLRAVSIVVFVVGWIGQFYGHKVEGKKPSFFKDVAFLLIGPLWVLQKFAPGLFRQ
ncbi:MAG: DUF962 domain-containing protein [Bdellovibrionaceae bacterium]|nr:DUF962 domain-containing protein [Pseudobdellovibrionaceae bacterium]MBX3032977.1 DUF962 domain-containing protein [Pseudobdellovibrionaceae bacterium]